MPLTGLSLAQRELVQRLRSSRFQHGMSVGRSTCTPQRDKQNVLFVFTTKAGRYSGVKRIDRDGRGVEQHVTPLVLPNVTRDALHARRRATTVERAVFHVRHWGKGGGVDTLGCLTLSRAPTGLHGCTRLMTPWERMARFTRGSVGMIVAMMRAKAYAK